MDTDQKRILGQTWAALAPLGVAAAELFYDRLFADNPDIARLFDRSDMHRQQHKLLSSLDYVIKHLDDLDTLLPTLEQLGRRHAGYGVRDHHYEAVGAALLWTLREGLGRDWTPPVAAAWQGAYEVVSGVMRHAGQSASGARQGTVRGAA